MKIAVVFDGLGFGGIERLGIDYIKIMQGLGHEVDVYNLTPKYAEMEKELSDRCNVIHHFFPHKLCPELYSYGVKKWWWGKYAYPIIYTGMSILIGIRKIFEKHRNKKYDLAIAFAGHFNDLTFVANGFIRTEKKMCWLHGTLAEYLLMAHGYGTLYRKIKNLLTSSDYMQDAAMRGNKFLRGLNINRIFNPVSISDKIINKHLVEELKSKYGEFFLMVGRFTKQKDQITVVNAMKILKDKYNINNKILFVGDGEEKIKVEELSSKLGIKENVIFIGSREDVQNFYCAAKLFVHSSPAEGFGLVLIEAMQFGIPIVATKSLPGVQEILRDNEYGLVCPVGDAEEMANCIKKMITDEVLYNYYKSQGYKRMKDFEPAKIAIEFKMFLEMII